MANPRWGLGAHLSNYTSKWFSEGLIYLHCALRADYKYPASAQWSPYYTSNEFHQTVEPGNRRKKEKKEKKRTQPSIRRVMESTLRWAEAEYRAAQGSLHNPRQDIHYCHKPPSQQNRRAGFSERESSHLHWLWFHAAGRISPGRWNQSHPTPTLVFPLCRTSSPLDGSPQTWLHAESGHHTQEGEPLLREPPGGEG